MPIARAVAAGAALFGLLASGGCAPPKTELRGEPAPAATATAPAMEARPAAGTMTAEKPGNMKPYPATTYVAGPSLTPTAPLLAWLDAHRDTRIKVPVVIRLLPPRHGIETSYLGATDAPPAADAVHVHLSDSKLGVSLLDHVAHKCKGQRVCVLWLEGRWGGDDELPPTPPGPPLHPFSLYRVHDPVEPDLASPHVLIATEEKPERREE